MRRIAIYGKGGIGKSTTTCNLSAALAAKGARVMQIGCDPKSDSTRLLMRGERIPTVLDVMREGGRVSLDDIVFEAPCGVLCVESGGPIPGTGCAGRGIVTAFDKLGELSAFERYKPDYVIYDVLGDVVCGGFAMPLRGKYSRHVLVVTSGEMMSLYAASNIMRALEGFKSRDYARLAGLVANKRGLADEDEKLARFCEEEGASIVAEIPRSEEIQLADHADELVVEAYPQCAAAEGYARLASFVEGLADDARAG